MTPQPPVREPGPNHFARGILLRNQGRLEEAAHEFRAAMVAEPRDANAAAMLSITLNSLGEFPGACSAAEEAVRRDPTEPLAFLAVGYALAATARLEGAVRAAREALRLDPTMTDAYVLLGQLARLREDWPAVLRWSESALAVDPLDERAAVLRSKALIGLGRVEQSTEGLQLILRHDPENSDVHEMLGVSLLHAGKESEALAHLREALRINPNSDEARLHLAEAMKSRSGIYRTILRAALWFHRRKNLKTGMIGGIFLVYASATMLSVMFWKPALPWLFAGFGLGLVTPLFRRLSIGVFDLLLQLDPWGRHLLSGPQRLGAWMVGGFLLVATGALALSLFSPIFLIFAIPTATIAPWVLYGVVVSSSGRSFWAGLAAFGVPVMSAELGLLLMALASAFRLGENLFGVGAFLLVVTFIWLSFAGWFVDLVGEEL